MITPTRSIIVSPRIHYIYAMHNGVDWWFLVWVSTHPNTKRKRPSTFTWKDNNYSSFRRPRIKYLLAILHHTSCILHVYRIMVHYRLKSILTRKKSTTKSKKYQIRVYYINLLRINKQSKLCIVSISTPFLLASANTSIR